MGTLSGIGQLLDNYSHRFFRKIPINLSSIKAKYRYKFIYELYPYRLYKLYDNHVLIKNGFEMYHNTLETISKIMKKYYFLKYSKYSYCNSLYIKLFEDMERQMTVVFAKLDK